MARIRTIKPDFWRHEVLSTLPEATHMLAAALLNYADDDGYFNANPGLIKGECCPLREPSVSIQDSLTALAAIGFVRLGHATDGRRYGQITKFAEHQTINRKTASKIKELQIVWEDARSTHTQLSESSRLEGKGREGEMEGKGREERASAPPPDSPDLPVEEAIEAWNAVARECGLSQVQHVTGSRTRKLAARLRDGGGIEGWRIACGKVRGSPFLRGETGKRDWRASFDFLLQESSFTKVMEGQFDGRANGPGRTGSSDLEAGLAGIAQGVAEHRGSS